MNKINLYRNSKYRQLQSCRYPTKRLDKYIYENDDYDVFMAIVEKVGKDRRGNVVYERDDEGSEILYVDKKEWVSYNRQGELIARHRTERVKHIDDDLPKISAEYIKYKEGKQ